MPGFNLPPISPLVGSRRSAFFKVLKQNKVHPKYYLKIVFTVILLYITSAFHWLDRLMLNRKVRSFIFREPPLFIIGHWRSGTTLLHNLLTRDPAAGYTTTYQAVFPNNLKSKWLFKTFMRVFMPNERPGDNIRISVGLPQEDEYALSNITHRSFYHFFYFPSSYRSLYSQNIRFENLSEKAKQIWKRNYRQMVIKALINTDRSRAILKNPVNTGRMLNLLDIFPGANFIFIVRNPVMVYMSTKKFFGQLFPTVNLEIFTMEDISNMILDTYGRLLQDYLSDREKVNPDRLIEVRYESLVENPLEELERVYTSFRFPDFENLKQSFLEYLDTIKGYQEDTYTMGQQELDRVLEHVGFAMKQWNYNMPDNLRIVN